MDFILNKRREIGDIITETFRFFGQQFAPLFIGTLLYVLPFVVILSIATYGLIEGGAFEQFDGPTVDFFIGFGILFLVALPAMIAPYMTVAELGAAMYRRETELGHTHPNIEISAIDVAKAAYQRTGSYIGVTLLSAIITIVAFVILFIPGIYVAVSISFVYMIIAVDRKSTVDAVSMSFQHIKEHWWDTFGLLIVMGLISFVISMVFEAILGGASLTGLFSEALQGTEYSDQNVGFVFTLIITFLIDSITGFLPVIAVMLQYFSIRSERGGGMNRIIDSIGADPS